MSPRVAGRGLGERAVLGERAAGRFSARVRLCRQVSASRIRSRFSGVATMSVFTQSILGSEGDLRLRPRHGGGSGEQYQDEGDERGRGRA